MYIRLINGGAEGIIEPFYDGGESYPESHKYKTLENYTVVPSGSAEQTWSTIGIDIKPNGVTAMVRSCELELRRFDTLSVVGKIPKEVLMTVCINGKKVIEENGSGFEGPYNGVITDKKITEISFEFKSTDTQKARVDLSYISVIDSSFIKYEDLYFDSCYPDWEGCFSENAEVKPFTNAIVSDNEAAELRRKMAADTFARDYNETKRYAESVMDSTPEKEIRIILGWSEGEGDAKFYMKASTLAFVGFIEKDTEMLKLAARHALSIAVTDKWCVFEKETAPGVTWYHRSFWECYATFAISVVLEFAGSVLTWHGQNILYNALITKGIPRLDADFKTMEYIYHMNQGLAFSTGYVYALATLAARYPRYKTRLLEIEKDVDEMLLKTINSDGGCFEGPGYWSYTFDQYISTACILSKHHGLSLKEYVGSRLDRASDFALIMSTNDNMVRTVGDSSRRPYGKTITNFFAQITENPKWQSFFNGMKATTVNCAGLAIFYFIFAKEIPNTTAIEENEKFVTFSETGYTYLKRGAVEFLGISGKSFSHCHHDKGSFLIDADNKPVLIDRGICNYRDAEADKMSASCAHNLAVPMFGGVYENQNSQHGYGATLVTSEYKNGCFTWVSDNDNVWDKSKVSKSIRTVVSKEPNVFEVTDEFELKEPGQIAFILNTYDASNVKLEPIDWKPLKTEAENHGVDFEKKDVFQLRLLSEVGTQFCIKTRITILRGDIDK